MAYRAVMTPVEGTILTVVREAAEAVLKKRNELNTIEDVMVVYLDEAKKSLENTPELLPVLKQAGVVDSGGAGFIKIIEGMLLAIQGEMIPMEEERMVDTNHHMAQNIEDAEITFAYCTEFIVKLDDYETFDRKLKKYLNEYG